MRHIEQRVNRKHTDESLRREAANFSNTGDWVSSKGGKASYEMARSRGILKEITAHFVRKKVKRSVPKNKKPVGYWNIKKNVLEVVDRCDSYTEFVKNYKGAHASSLRNGWLDEVKILLPKRLRSVNSSHIKYTDQDIIDIGRSFKNRRDWKNDGLSGFSSSYTLAQKRGLLGKGYFNHPKRAPKKG